MRVAVGADHGGFPLKADIVELLKKLGHEVTDVGAHEYDAADDYPDFALAAAKAVASGNADRAVILCGSGVGASVAANKVRGVRAAVCHDLYSAAQGVEHDDMNALCLGARIIEGELALALVTAFMGAKFSGEERHARRLKKVLDEEAG
ncbi:MAG: RpiB/LacA/LacB family sugar-phosphate isomerase [Chloroflexi bacterium]|nr:RpiB/LacA/LacB family sugar-phosphate isomerase [Chloroflexota bacterium]